MNCIVAYNFMVFIESLKQKCHLSQQWDLAGHYARAKFSCKRSLAYLKELMENSVMHLNSRVKTSMQIKSYSQCRKQNLEFFNMNLDQSYLF